jgi:hypothetical protein
VGLHFTFKAVGKCVETMIHFKETQRLVYHLGRGGGGVEAGWLAAPSVESATTVRSRRVHFR